jgi:mRNA interferase HicA
VKRRDLIRKISEAAKNGGVDFGSVREKGPHSIYRCGTQNVVIPRHREIAELTAQGIMRDLDDVLGKDWWR